MEEIKEAEDLIVNGRVYPMWQQFVQRKEEWIGGTLRDMSDGKQHDTRIKDIRLEPNGPASAMFSVIGEGFTCACDVQWLGITPTDIGPDFLALSGYGGHTWGFKKP